MKTVFFILLFCFCQMSLLAQQDTLESPQPNTKRLLLTAGVHSALWAGSLIALDQAWYRDFNRSPFHTFNDNDEWNQVDKAGHAWTTYGLSRVSAAAWRWTGLNRNTSALLGAASGMLFESIVEFQDGFSQAWGFSWGDMGADLLGAGVFLFQDIHWREQKIQIKMSYYPHKYATDLLARRNQLFGTSFQERILKDYNAQTYWLSINMASCFSDLHLPAWLSISFGYGAANLLGARGNSWKDEEGLSYDYSSYPRLRRYFLSPDIDLTKIRSRKKWIRSVLSVLNAIKIPAPALELNSKGTLSFHVIKF